MSTTVPGLSAPSNGALNSVYNQFDLSDTNNGLTITLEAMIIRMLAANEVSSSSNMAFALSPPVTNPEGQVVGKSGWTFGWVQFDVGSGPNNVATGGINQRLEVESHG